MAATTMEEATTAEEFRWTKLFAALLTGLLLLRLVALALNGTDLFFDEAQYWSWSLEPAFGYYSKPPLVAWLIGLATSACGPSEACVRLPSPLVHTGTAVAIFFLGRHLYDARTGAIAGLAFATLPGVSLSAGIISTDVPLLFFWAVALLALVHLAHSRAWWPGVLLGLALGLGLNAKYAMGWFVVCLAVYLWAEPARRALLKDARLYLALGLAALMIAPNLAWNASHGFATFSHTADNAKWTGPLLNPLRALEFFGTQFGVFGPILFASLIVISVRAWRQGAPAADRLLLSFTLPVLVVITLQALLSRAHANWAAVSYVAGTVLVTATLVRELSWRWLTASFFVNGAAALMLVAGTSLAGQATLPFGPDPFARTLGWRDLAEAVRGEIETARAAGKPFGAVLTDERSVTAELLYYMREEETPVLAWRAGSRPQDHYELTRPFTGAAREPVLLVALGRDAGAIRSSFENAVEIGRRELPAGPRQLRRVTFHALSGYKPK
jgi:4-amino-4-deoxy-L-arabinose transferase-like glycosyltransferase